MSVTRKGQKSGERFPFTCTESSASPPGLVSAKSSSMSVVSVPYESQKKKTTPATRWAELKA